MADGAKGLLLAGVGGQGVILASMIVADALMRAGFDVKQSEVHGMAQRGGSVVSHIRWKRDKVDSPLVEKGSAEVLAAFEWAEAIRWVEYVRDGGAVVTDLKTIVPPGACNDTRAWSRAYPRFDGDLFKNRRLESRFVDATANAAALGNVRAANSVILGSVAAFVDIDTEHWEAAITSLVPKGTEEVNLAAFRAGRQAPSAEIPLPGPDPEVAPGPHLIEIRQDWCKSCDICPRVCPEYCLKLDTDGTLLIVDADACTGCRLCEMLCPDFAITIHPPAETADPVPAASGRTTR
ncbi:MAG: 2-oxoacid:acceptor oxidoreductase family protein [Acidimicrobiia bacterium]